MRKLSWAVAFVIVMASSHLFANTDQSFGFRFTGLKNGFSYGVDYTTPSFANWFDSDVSARITADLATFEGVRSGGTLEEQFFYGIINTGLSFSHGYITPKIRLYSEWGLSVFIPESDFANDIVLDAYTFGGLEMFVKPKLSTYIELGGTYFSFAKADGLVNQPNFSTGFNTTLGGRLYF